MAGWSKAKPKGMKKPGMASKYKSTVGPKGQVKPPTAVKKP